MNRALMTLFNNTNFLMCINRHWRKRVRFIKKLPHACGANRAE